MMRYQLRNLPHRLRGWREELQAAIGRGNLSRLEAFLVDPVTGAEKPLGILSRRSVTTIGAAFLVDCLQGTAEPENLRYHSVGTGTTAESVNDTALVTAAGSRVSGDQTEPASNQYRTSATFTFSGDTDVTEHGIHWASSGASTLFDRSVFAAIPGSTSLSIRFEYTLTIATGG
jgi:hypothetical protein